jgi:hypothetical protein
MDPVTQPAGQRLARNVFLYAVLLLAFGVVLPWSKGLDFFDPVLLCAYASMSIIFAAPAAVQAFDSRPASMAQALLRILAAAGFGEAIAVAMLLFGFLTVWLTQAHLLFGPDLAALGYGLLFGLAASVALGALAAWVAVQFSSKVARAVVRLVFLGLLAAFFLKARWLPSVAATAALIAAAVAAVFLVLLRSNLRRA